MGRDQARLANDAAFCVGKDEITERLNHRFLVTERLKTLLGIFQKKARLVENLVGLSQRRNLFRREPPPGQAFDIQAMWLCRMTAHSDIRWNILGNDGAESCETVRADPTELMNQGESTQDGMIINAYMASQGSIIREDDIVADDAVVSDMAVRHDEVVIPYPGDPPSIIGAPVKRGELPNDIAITYLKPAALPPEFLVLGFLADYSELKYPVVATNRRWSADYGMRPDGGTGIDGDMRPDYRVWADFDVVCDGGR